MKNRKNISLFLILAILLIAIKLIDGEGLADGIYRKLLLLPGIIVGLAFHEFAHALASNFFGDPTPKLQGRLTVNPIAHIDLIGLFALIFAGFGWGRPVQIDAKYYKRPRLAEFIVAIAGVTMNLIISIIVLVILRLIGQFVPYWAVSDFGEVIYYILVYAVVINVTLMVFNLLPIPPLDGFSIITQIFNLRKYSWYYKLYNYGGLILLLFVVSGATDIILGHGVSAIVRGLQSLIL